MGRIKLKFYDKTYIIEYANRLEVKQYFQEIATIKEKDETKKLLKELVILLKAGLVEHHANEMPSDNDILNWATSMPNAQAFYEKLMSMVQDVISLIDKDTKNLNWEVVD